MRSTVQPLRLAISEEPRSLDPLVGIDCNSAHILMMIGEGLMRMGTNGTPVPGIAQSYTVSPDGTLYTFYLRKSYWSNGDLLTAYDFERSWKRAVDPEFACGFYYLDCIKNMAKGFRHEVTSDEIGVRAESASVLSVQLEYPIPKFVDMTTLAAYFPVPCSLALPLANGPFRLARQRSKEKLILEKNPFYWDANSVYLEGIELSIVSSSFTQAQLFEKRQLDWYGAPLCWPSSESIEILKRRFSIHENLTHDVQWLVLNTQAPPFHNKKLRQAFARAIDRQQIVHALLAHQAIPSTSILPLGLTLQSDHYFQDGDVTTARQLFEEGLSEMALDRDHFPLIILRGVGESGFRFQLCQAVQQQWQEAFSIRVTLQKEDFNILLDRFKSGSYQAANLGWISWIDDPIWFLKPFKDRSTGLNHCRWESSEYCDLIEASLKPTTQGERNIVLHQAESLLVDEMPLIPLFSMKGVYFKNPNLQGVYLSPFGRIDFKWAYFDKG